MNDTSAAAHNRVEQAQDYYTHVRCEIFPRIRTILSSVSAFAAAVSPTPVLQATFATVSALSAASAIYGHYSKDSFGMSNSIWLKIASNQLAQAKKEQYLALSEERAATPSAPKYDLGRSSMF